MSSVVSGVGLAIYTNVLYYVTYNSKFQGIYKINPSVATWGQWAFLTHHCLLMQIISSSLHLISTIYKPITPLRDFFFTTLAYPASAAVVSTFWTVWFAFGPELIMPIAVKIFMPNWVNHSVHSVPLVVNLLLMALVPHRYPKRGYLVPLSYMVFYFGLMFACKYTTGFFPYPYLDKMNPGMKFIYFLGNGGYLLGLYIGNKSLSQLLHGIQTGDNSEDYRPTPNLVPPEDQDQSEL